MAHGILCKHCGYQEGDHDLFLKAIEADDKKQDEQFFWKMKFLEKIYLDTR